jgi:glycolate dehydrogenase FAD-binding subunit
MAVSARALVDGFRAIVGDAHARDDLAARERAAVDNLVPAIVVAPSSTEETGAVMALAAAEALAIVPRGSGTSLPQGRPVERVDLVLDLSRLKRIVEYNADDLTVTAEAGVTGAELAHTLGVRGQCLALDPPGVGARTLGGLVATNASGPLRARYGTLRDLLLGVRFVQPDGVVTWGGSKVVKSVTGYDVPKLMVGALGTLGVLTELTLRLHARPEVERTTLVTLRDAPAAHELVARMLDSSLQPTRLEILDGVALAALGAKDGVGIATSFGSVESAVTDAEAQVARLAHGAGALAVTSPPALWPAYDRIWRRDPDATMLTVGTTPARLADTFAAVADAHRAIGEAARVMTGGCAGVGSLRVSIRKAAASAVAAFVARLRASMAPWEGTVIVQGAPRAVRTAIDPWGPVPAEAMALTRAIKSTFDPERRLNPGRFVGGL